MGGGVTHLQPAHSQLGLRRNGRRRAADPRPAGGAGPSTGPTSSTRESTSETRELPTDLSIIYFALFSYFGTDLGNLFRIQRHARTVFSTYIAHGGFLAFTAITEFTALTTRYI